MTFSLEQRAEQYRPLVIDEMRAVVGDSSAGLFAWMRYHLGWEEADGQPSAHASGGKMLRPVALLLAAELVGGSAEGALPAAAAMVADAVFGLVGVIRMAGAKLILVVAIIAGARILVLDLQSDRRAGGAALEEARKDLGRVGLVPLGGEAALAGSAPVQIPLEVLLGEWQARGTALDDHTDATAVDLAPGGDAEYRSEGAAHSSES